MLKQKIIVVLVVLLLTFQLSSQNEERKWTFGINSSTIVFFDKEASSKVKDGLNSQIPSIQISRDLTKNISLDFIYTFEGIEPVKGQNAFKYSSFDTYLKYDIPLFFNIHGFGGVGFGLIGGASTTPNPQTALSLNFMLGGTLWITDRFGLTGRLISKQVSSKSESMGTHVQGLAGILYKFDFNLANGQSRKRLWGVKH